MIAKQWVRSLTMIAFMSCVCLRGSHNNKVDINWNQTVRIPAQELLYEYTRTYFPELQKSVLLINVISQLSNKEIHANRVAYVLDAEIGRLLKHNKRLEKAEMLCALAVYYSSDRYNYLRILLHNYPDLLTRIDKYEKYEFPIHQYSDRNWLHM